MSFFVVEADRITNQENQSLDECLQDPIAYDRLLVFVDTLVKINQREKIVNLEIEDSLVVEDHD